MSIIYGIKSINDEFPDPTGNINITGASIVAITADDLLIMASNSTIPVGIDYRVINFDTDLYGGTDIFVRSIASNQLDTKGVGVFYNPKYELSSGFGIWSKFINVNFNTPNGFQGFFEENEIVVSDIGGVGYLKCDGLIEYISGNWNSTTMITGSSSGVTMSLYGSVSTPSYSIGDIVHWGGISWTNVTGNVGNSTSIYELNSDWSIIPYNPDDYNISYDNIIISYNLIDYIDGRILSRIDSGGNNVSFTHNYYSSLNDPLIDNPIRLFQWGNNYSVHENVVINSSFECLNFLSPNFNNKINNSSLEENILSLGCTFHKNILVNSDMSGNFLSDSQVYLNEVYNSSISSNRIYYNSLSSNILKNNSSISLNNFTMNGSCVDNILEESYIESNSIFNSYINKNTLSHNSRIDSNQILGNNKNISDNSLYSSRISYNSIRGGNIYNNRLDNDSNIISNIINTNSGSSTIANNVLLRASIGSNELLSYICNIDDNILNFDTDISANTGTYSISIRNKIKNNLVITTGSTKMLVNNNGEMKEQNLPTLEQLISPSGAQLSLPISYIDAGNQYVSNSSTNRVVINSQTILLYDTSVPTESTSINKDGLTINSISYTGENNVTRTGLMYRVNNSNRLDIDLSTTYTGTQVINTIDASGKIAIVNNTAPSSSTSTGVIGEIRVTSTFLYVCVATNTWVRSALLTW